MFRLRGIGVPWGGVEMPANPDVRRLYDTHPEFRVFVECWVRDYRCPYPFGDWLDEHDLPAAANCARYAATVPNRRVKRPMVEFGESEKPIGLYPVLNRVPIIEDGVLIQTAEWAFTTPTFWSLTSRYADTVPDRHIQLEPWSELETYRSEPHAYWVAVGETAADAIVDLLSRWIPAPLRTRRLS